MEYIAPIRIEKIELKNFKGVKNGVVEFNCLKNSIEKDTVSDILGIYGQNGSGKTTLLEAINIARLAMMGEEIPDNKYKNIISQNAEKAEMNITFQVKNYDESFYHVEYHFSLEKKRFSVKGKSDSKSVGLDASGVLAGTAVTAASLAGAPIIAPVVAIAATTSAAGIVANKLAKKSKGNRDQSNGARIITKLVLSDEVLNIYGNVFGTEVRFGPLFDTRLPEDDTETVFLPKAKHKLFFPNETALALKELHNYKTRYRYNSKSFIFCDEVSQMFIDQKEKNDYANIILHLKAYALEKLKVLDTKIIGSSKDELIPIFLSDRTVKIRRVDSSLSLDKEGFDELKEEFKRLNVVLKQIVPGLQLELHSKGKPSDDAIFTVTIYTDRDGIKIPLGDESTGIIRIVTVSGLFSYAFANESVTVAIDEIDAGIYEYLLGELLLLFEEYGAGQLIFTSHNLRPMEVLNRKFIYFTTTNSEHRYLKPKSIRKENNLRDVYLREIINGGQDEDLYESAKHGKIAAALQKAGEIVGEE